MSENNKSSHKRSIIQKSIALALGLSISNVTLAEEAEFIGTIELGESKRDVQTSTSTAMTIIDQNEINDRQASTIAELIDTVPGVTLVNGSSPSGSGINIRGFGANGTYGTDQKVAISIDGATTGAEELYRIGNQLFTDPYLFKSVSVNRGTIGSFEYGSGIIGGLVKLETIDASDMTGGENGFKVRLTGGVYSNKSGSNGSATVGWQPTEGVEFLANYSYREQGFQEDADGNEIGNSEFELPSYLVKAKIAFNQEHSLSFSLTNTNSSDRDVPYDSFGLGGSSFGNVDRDVESETRSLKYNYNPVNNDFINLDIDLNYADQKIDSSGVIRTLPPFALRLYDADHRYETTKLTVKNTAFIETGALVHDLRFGAEYIYKKRESAFAAPGGTDKRQAVFIVDDIEIGDSWTVSPALRYEHSKLEGDTYTSRGGVTFINPEYSHSALMGGLGVRYQFTNGLALFGSYARTEGFPILDDLQNLVFVEQPELSTTKEVGFSFDKVGLFSSNDKFAFKANYYQTDLDDVTSYFGVDKVELEGLEIEASLALSNGIYIDLNSNIVIDADENKTNGDNLDWRNTPADTVYASVGKRFGSFADVSAEMIYSSDLKVNTRDFDTFTVFNVRATLTPQSLPDTEFRFSIENLTDKQYKPVLATRPATGRNFKLTFSHLF